MISERPIPKASELNKTLPTHQYVMDWDPDFPESVVKERKIPSRLITNYSPVYVLTQLFNPKRIPRMFIRDAFKKKKSSYKGTLSLIGGRGSEIFFKCPY